MEKNCLRLLEKNMRVKWSGKARIELENTLDFWSEKNKCYSNWQNNCKPILGRDTCYLLPLTSYLLPNKNDDIQST